MFVRLQILLKGKRSTSDEPDLADEAPPSPILGAREFMPGSPTIKPRNSLVAASDSNVRRASRISFLRRKSKVLRRVHPDLETLLLYFQGVRVHQFDLSMHGLYEIGSFKESKFQRMVNTAELLEQCIRFNERNVSRVYPDNIRMNSSNFDPMPMWATGCQFVALNYQTQDRHTFLNDMFFRQNGGKLEQFCVCVCVRVQR
jgi:hypothetical protein